jgi:hypothetical protein
MSLPETFYIALCVTILLLGVVYWFWTQVQYLQRKVNLLDNVVYEMKTLVSNLPGNDKAGLSTVQNTDTNPKVEDKIEAVIEEAYAPPPESVAGDLEAEQLVAEADFESFSGGIETNTQPAYDPPVQDDLQPGGLAVPAKKSDAAIESPLNGLSLKELRKMAEANNIPGANDLKKKELIKALRDKVSSIISLDSPSNVMSFDDVLSPNFE